MLWQPFTLAAEAEGRQKREDGLAGVKYDARNYQSHSNPNDTPWK